MDLEIDRSKPVLVTGATGYIAGRVVERLLQEGLTVHATVRDPSKTERLGYLRALAEGTDGSIEFFAADLLEDGSFAAGMTGCGVVFHIASPFVLEVRDPQRELVDPAVKGTRNVLEEANRTPSVERVVLTSSCAAVYSDNVDLQSTATGAFTEDDWNTNSTLDHNPYSLSKTLAEREAWTIHDAQDRWRLVAVNPCMVLGPGVKSHPGSESQHLIQQLGDGTMASGVPDLGMGFVDVRDLAEAHLRAAFVPSAEGRHIISGHDSSFPEVAAILRARFPNFRLPKRVAPKWLIWLIGPLVNKAITRRYISRNAGLPWRGDASKSIRELGMTYRPLAETLHDFFQMLIDAGELKPRA